MMRFRITSLLLLILLILLALVVLRRHVRLRVRPIDMPSPVRVPGFPGLFRCERCFPCRAHQSDSGIVLADDRSACAEGAVCFSSVDRFETISLVATLFPKNVQSCHYHHGIIITTTAAPP